ncbi:MAG TPA: sugar phosphate isomerase/epimerase family protein [Planctomycetota bacterium]|nr:sugar phosphate isomerase/epimerase family protein [Planctomycetota bacterium]
MKSSFERRQFLGQATLFASGAALGLAPHGGSLAAAAPAAEASGRAPLFKLSLAQWSLNKAIFGKKLDNLDFAKKANELGFDAVEYVNQFFKDRAADSKYLAEMKKRAAGEGVYSLLIMCDDEGNLGDPDPARRTRAVENHHKWVEAAAYLGCHSIRVNAESGGTYDEQVKHAADGLRRLSEFGEKRGIGVIVENHGGLSSNGEWLAKVMKTVDHPGCGTLPDFGNFDLGGGKTYDRYKGVAELMPFAKAVSAKSHDFDDAGNEKHTDYRRMMKIVLQAGYHGYVGIEYEGDKLGEVDGILATKRLLEKVRGELGAA